MRTSKCKDAQHQTRRVQPGSIQLTRKERADHKIQELNTRAKASVANGSERSLDHPGEGVIDFLRENQRRDWQWAMAHRRKRTRNSASSAETASHKEWWHRRTSGSTSTARRCESPLAGQWYGQCGRGRDSSTTAGGRRSRTSKRLWHGCPKYPQRTGAQPV